MVNNLGVVAWWSTKPAQWSLVPPALAAAVLAAAVAVATAAQVVAAPVAAATAVALVVAVAALAAVVVAVAVAVAAINQLSTVQRAQAQQNGAFGALFVGRALSDYLDF